MTRLTRMRLRLVAGLTILSTLVGVLDGYLGDGVGEASKAAAMLHTGTAYFIGGAIIWGLEILVAQSPYGAAMRRLYFLTAIALKALTVVLVVIWVRALTVYLYHGGLNIDFVFNGAFFRTLAFVLLVIITMQVVIQVVRIIGGRTLVNFILGKYRRPVREDKIFMFLDMVGSTTLAEQLGDEGVQAMITKFFFDITEPIVEHGGEIHRYIGDEVIVTWPIREGAANMRSIRCCLAIADKVHAMAAKYERQFGAAPACRIGLHGGPVVISQCGDYKQEISYYGDTINTASRVEQECKALDCQFLVTGDLLDRITLEPNYQAVAKGVVQLRGRETETALYTIELT